MNKGHWVKFDAPPEAFPGAHRSPDGKVVGILVPGGLDSLTGNMLPSKINIVTKDTGHNLVGIVDNEPRNISVDPSTTPHVRCEIPGDCPTERVRHLVEGK